MHTPQCRSPRQQQFEVVSHDGRVIAHITATTIGDAHTDLARGKNAGFYPRNAHIGGPRPRAHAVRDYEAIDRRDRVIAGPFKTYGDAKDAAGSAGAVRFVPAKRKPSTATEARRGKHDPQAALAKRWMRDALAQDMYGEFVDNRTGEVNMTRLAEEYAHASGHSEWLDDETNPVWDWALEAAEAFQRAPARTREAPRPSKARETRSAHNPSPTRRQAKRR